MHFANVWEAIADVIPDRPAIIQGARITSWRLYDDRAARLGASFAAAGLGYESKIGMFLFNSPEYLETQFAGFKMRMCPVNVNYRYLDEELAYLLDNADCEAIVFHSGLADRIDRVRGRLPKLRCFIQVFDPELPEAELIEGATWFEDVITNYEPAPRQERKDDDLYMLYTGGTTGMPKGVMYPNSALCEGFLGLVAQNMGRPPFASLEDVVGTVAAMNSAGIQMKAMPCCPLMHGTGIWLGAFTSHLIGGATVLMTNRGLDPVELFETVEREGVNTLVIVGDAFARPMVAALTARADSGSPFVTSSILAVISSGAMFSQELKAAMLDHMPQARIVDTLGSSEGGMGMAISTKDDAATTATFSLLPDTKVFDEDDQEIGPGSGQIGRVASPATSLGYFKDPEKSAKTFRSVGGRMYSFPGDMATVAADGSITLLGRGSHCINTGGEKVFPEEVEEAVKTHAGIADCLIFGIDDERFGQRVVGIASLAGVELSGGSEAVIRHTKDILSSFKVPKQLLLVADVPRAPNGKADYVRARELFAAQV
jgi:3-oxocholest-4-en-26-oate---CoA ligase